jgi:hypothetical protein
MGQLVARAIAVTNRAREGEIKCLLTYRNSRIHQNFLIVKGSMSQPQTYCTSASHIFQIEWNISFELWDTIS